MPKPLANTAVSLRFINGKIALTSYVLPMTSQACPVKVRVRIKARRTLQSVLVPVVRTAPGAAGQCIVTAKIRLRAKLKRARSALVEIYGTGVTTTRARLRPTRTG